ncbi:hypothetical protein MUN88_14265 [Gracilibacillus caseinilyticus]|uniref:Uncharacterized protein n=1 Tax=Gracilibacillus caseinilyticus TaxID=2932256 RepID=A0ABY4EYH8_9BACI|nr:hypothetical protein [Gracilibacillus caseinilyticus]UOQ47231.1 hypothetical protein MUN88_14265 [Gracilibacillus caseinilyticus]
MLLRLKHSESALILLHMAMTRKSARNTFKRNHKKESKELLASFDEVKEELEKAVDQTDENQGFLVTDYHFNVREIQMLYSFLSSYIPLLSDTVKKAGDKDEDRYQVLDLQRINVQLQKMLEGAGVV